MKLHVVKNHLKQFYPAKSIFYSLSISLKSFAINAYKMLFSVVLVHHTTFNIWCLKGLPRKCAYP